MPEIGQLNRLLSARYERSMQAWRQRLDEDMRLRHAPRALVLVRITTGEDDEPPQMLEAASTALGIRILRHLGGCEFLVTLLRDGDETCLALKGHLSVTRDGYAMTAV